MKLTQKLLSLLHRVFDPDPEQFLALRISYGGGMTWTVSEGVLTTSVVGGIGQGFSIDLTTVTFAQLVNYVSTHPGYQVLYADGSDKLNLSARALMDATGNIAQSNGNALYAYTSLVWAYMEAVGTELKAAKAQIPEAIKQMSIPSASSDWIDELGSYYGVPRLQGEGDTSYGARIIAETVRPRTNNVAIERAISYYTGQSVKVTDVTIYGPAFPKYNGAITRNSAYQYQPLSTPIYGLFDVQLGYDLLGGTDQTAFSAIVSGIVNRLRAAGTHLRALSLQSSSLSDSFTPPVDGAMLLAANMVMTDSRTAPTEGTFVVNGALTVMSDTSAAPTEPQAFDAIRYNQCYNGLRTRDGAIKYAGNTVETNPVVAKDWNFMTGTLPADVTFSRASTATYFDKNGVLQVAAVDQPRFEFDPVTNALRGLLFEESRTNKLTYSSDLTNAAWVKTQASVSVSSAICPDGSVGACVIIPNTSSVSHTVGSATIAAGGSETYTASVLVKAAGYSQIRVRVADSVGLLTGPVYDVATESFISDSGVVTKLKNGWYKISVSATTDPAATWINLQVWIYSAGTSVFAGDGTSGIYVWGAQLELGAYPTSTIPTTTVAVTRAADTADISTLSPWYNASAGTMLIDSTSRQATTGTTRFGVSIGTDSANYIGMAWATTLGPSLQAYMRNAGVGPSIGPAGYSADLRQVLAWDANGLALSNGGAAATTAAPPAGGIPAAANIRIGYSHYNNSNTAPMVLKRLSYWATRFPDNTLPTLSTTSV